MRRTREIRKRRRGVEKGSGGGGERGKEGGRSGGGKGK